MTRVKTFADDESLFSDFYTFDRVQHDSSRTVMGFLDIVASIGGVQRVLLTIINLLIPRFAELSFIISVINCMVLVKTKDSSLDF